MVNTVTSIESVKMMLDHLGQEEATRGIEKAVSKILSEGKFKTREMGEERSTSETGDAFPTAILD